MEDRDIKNPAEKNAKKSPADRSDIIDLPPPPKSSPPIIPLFHTDTAVLNEEANGLDKTEKRDQATLKQADAKKADVKSKPESETTVKAEKQPEAEQRKNEASNKASKKKNTSAAHRIEKAKEAMPPKVNTVPTNAPTKKAAVSEKKQEAQISEQKKKTATVQIPIIDTKTKQDHGNNNSEKAPPSPSFKDQGSPRRSKASKRASDKKENHSKPTIGFTERDYLAYAGYKRREPKKHTPVKTVIGRIFVSLISVILFAVIALYGLCFTIAKGPSETVRNLLVLSAKQASATKWVPGLFLSAEEIEEIMANSEKVETDIISIKDYYTAEDSGEASEDEWEKAKDGMIFKTIKGSSYTAYMLIIKDPSRVYVGTATDNFEENTKGKNIFEITKDLGAVAAINGGEFPDTGGIGTGEHPIGLTYSGGKCVWNDGRKRTFIGFDKNNRLHAIEGATKAEADALGIRDAVAFQTGNVLITSDGENVTFYYAEGNNGTAQRTAIGQRADGAVIMLVTDGRTASSLGATKNDVIDVMVEHGAVTAAMLDGGSSAMMYYENYYEKYGYDTDDLDQYQKKGLVNKYKAFTNPRYMPTFFVVSPISEGGASSGG